jgi:hypothetical protein
MQHMDKIFGSLLQGVPTALVLGVALLWFIQPLNTRIDQVVTVMNREVIPVINELKKERVPGPEIKPLADISRQLNQALTALETQGRRTGAIELAVQDILKKQEINARETQRFALGAALTPYLTWDVTKTYKTGDLIPITTSPEAFPGPGHVTEKPKPLVGFVVKNPSTLNLLKRKWVSNFEEIGLEPKVLREEKPGQ